MRSRNALTVTVLLGVVAGMGGLTAAAVPLYDLFCRVTGYGGTPRVAQAHASRTGERGVTVRFDASVHKDLPWRFEPEQKQVTLGLGENALAFYRAVNTSDRPIVGHATFNVTPAKAAVYFNKIECFCFTEQVLQPGESVEMPVSFYVDPELARDRRTEEITTITLSYTFFRAADQESAGVGDAAAAGAKREGRS